MSSSSDHKDRNKYIPPPPPKVTFKKGSSTYSAHDHMNRLDLYGHSHKQVEDYHCKLVEKHMETIPRAHTAVVKTLAHSKGSGDPYIHVSAEKVQDKNGVPILGPQRGNPEVICQTHHIYMNREDLSKGYDVLPREYKKAVDKLNKIEQQPTGEGSI